MKQKSIETDTKTIQAFMFIFDCNENKKEEVMKNYFQSQNKRRRSLLQKKVLAVCDAILASSLKSKQTGHNAKDHLQTTRHSILLQK